MRPRRYKKDISLDYVLLQDKDSEKALEEVFDLLFIKIAEQKKQKRSARIPRKKRKH